MIFKKVHISGFGTYSHREIVFKEGLNVIYGENGSGKSTLHTFLRGMLFGIERGRGKAARKDLYTHYSPWEGGSFGGSLLLEENEKELLIERSFDTANKSLTLRHPDTGHILGESQEVLTEFLGGLTEEAYRNTISIGQLQAATDNGLSSQLTNHLSSITLAGNSSLNMTGALSQLAAQKKELKGRIDRTASTCYEALLGEIAEKEADLNSMSVQADDLDARIRSCRDLASEKKYLQDVLTEAITKDTASIQAHSMHELPDKEHYPDQVRDAYALCRDAQGGKENRAFHLKDLFLGLMAVLLFAALGAGTLFYEQLPFTNGALFPYPEVPFLVTFFGAAGFSLLITILHLVRARKEDIAANVRLGEAKSFLSAQLLKHLGSESISDSSVEELLGAMADYQALTTRVSEAKVQREKLLEETVALQQELSQLEEQMTLCRKESWDYELLCKNLANLEVRKQELEKLLAANSRLEQEIDAISLAEKTISQISGKLHESISPALNARVSEILYDITDGLYDRLYIDEDLTITLRCGGRSISMDSLSRGTIEQVYLALRIAAVELLFPGTTMPLLLDDTFSYYDDVRLANTLKWLAENYPGQVLIFTCHKREAELLGAAPILL